MTSEVWVDGFGNAVKTIVHGYDDAERETSISDGVTGYNYQYDLAGQRLDILMMLPNGWVNMAQNINGVEIHYLHNSIPGAIDNFKFVP